MGFSRIEKRKQDRMEKEEINFHKRVREGFLKIARANPERVVVVDGRGSTGEVFKNILKILRQRTDAF